MPKRIQSQLEGITGPLVPATKTRPKMVADNFQDAPTAAKVLNTQILTPLYTRIEQLERRQYITFSITAAAVVANTFPFTLPTPSFAVKALHVSQVWDATNNTAPQGLDLPVWRYSADGALRLEWWGLTASTKYNVTLEALG